MSPNDILSSISSPLAATRRGDEKILQFANRIQQLASTLKAMRVDIDDSERAMALLNGLQDQYDALISALDALRQKSPSFISTS